MYSVLLVEDHYDSGRVLSKLLGLDFNVKWVQTEKEAMKELNFSLFDAIISDIELGMGGNGISLMKKDSKQCRD